MKRLTTLFWKEWRDHRAALIALAITAPVLVLAAFLAFDDHLIQDAERTEPSVLFLPFLVLMVVIAVGSELFAGESRRDTLSFLSRMPDGLGRPLLAKMLFYVAASLGAVLYGCLVLLLVHALYGHTGAVWTAIGSNYHGWQVYALVAIAGGVWITLVSCWVPRGGGAILGGALLLGFVALPLFLLHRMEKHFMPTKPEVISLGIAATVTALIALYMSFGIGRRHGRGVWSSAWRGLAVVGALMLGTTAFGLERVHDIRTLSMDEPDFTIYNASALKGGRWLLVSVGEFKGPGRIWAVDLQTGDHQQVGPTGATTMASTYSRLGQVWFHEKVDGRRVRISTWFDAATGKVIKTLPWNVPSPEIDWIIEAEARDRTIVRLGERRAWTGRPPKNLIGNVAGGYVVEDESGKPKRRAMPGQVTGTYPWGWSASGNSNKVLYTVDPFTYTVRKQMPVDEAGRPLYGRAVAAKDPTRLLVQARSALYWVDMETGKAEQHRIKGVSRINSPYPIADRRVVLGGMRNGKAVRLIVDPNTGDAEIAKHPYHRAGIRMPDGRLFTFNFKKRRNEIYDERTGEATPLKGVDMIWPIGFTIEGSRFLACRGKKIVRYDMDTGEMETVWPR